MGYPVGCVSLDAVSRLELVAVVAGLLWIYFVVCFFSVWWDFVFFSFSLLRTHTAYCKYEATLPHVPLY